MPMNTDHATADAHFDDLETRPPEARDAALRVALPALIAHAVANSPAMAMRLRGIDPASIRFTPRPSRPCRCFARPISSSSRTRPTRRIASAASDGRLGSARAAATRASRVFVSPGPIREPETARPDYWRMARALFAAGFRAGDLVHNSYSYHFTPAGSMMETGAQAIGCTVFPAGTGQTELQVQAMAALKPRGYAGTPSFLRLLLDKADETGVALPSLARAALSGEPVPLAFRESLGARSIAAYQDYGTADLGLVAYETAAREGLVVDEGVIVKMAGRRRAGRRRRGRRDRRDDAQSGLPADPLRDRQPRPCYRARARPGEPDESAAGSAVPTSRPRCAACSSIPRTSPEIVRRHPQIGRARLVVEGAMADERMTLLAETGAMLDGLGEQIAQTIRDVTRLRGDVALVDPGSLPNDGKVIEDLRSPAQREGGVATHRARGGPSRVAAPPATDSPTLRLRRATATRGHCHDAAGR